MAPLEEPCHFNLTVSFSGCTPLSTVAAPWRIFCSSAAIVQRTLPLLLGNIDPRARLHQICTRQARELARSSSESTVTSRVRPSQATAPNLSDTDWRGGETCPARHE